MGVMGRQYLPLDEVNGWWRSTLSDYWEQTGVDERGSLARGWWIQWLITSAGDNARGSYGMAVSGFLTSLTGKGGKHIAGVRSNTFVTRGW